MSEETKTNNKKIKNDIENIRYDINESLNVLKSAAFILYDPADIQSIVENDFNEHDYLDYFYSLRTLIEQSIKSIDKSYDDLDTLSSSI